MKYKNAVLTSQNNPVPSLQRGVLRMIRKKKMVLFLRIAYKIGIYKYGRGVAGREECCRRPRQQIRRGQKLGGKMNILNEETGLQHSTNFKLLGRI